MLAAEELRRRGDPGWAFAPEGVHAREETMHDYASAPVALGAINVSTMPAGSFAPSGGGFDVAVPAIVRAAEEAGEQAGEQARGSAGADLIAATRAACAADPRSAACTDNVYVLLDDITASECAVGGRNARCSLVRRVRDDCADDPQGEACQARMPGLLRSAYGDAPVADGPPDRVVLAPAGDRPLVDVPAPSGWTPPEPPGDDSDGLLGQLTEAVAEACRGDSGSEACLRAAAPYLDERRRQVCAADPEGEDCARAIRLSAEGALAVDCIDDPMLDGCEPDVPVVTADEPQAAGSASALPLVLAAAAVLALQ